jgi:hypothetical protein
VAKLDLPRLREQLASIDVLERAAASFRADPDPVPRRDLVESIRGLLDAARLNPGAPKTL